MENNKKYFTPEEADKILPLVKSIVRDILNKGFEIRNIIDLSNKSENIDSQLQFLIGEMEDYVHELEDLGCFYKDWNFEMGVVDFPSVIDGKESIYAGAVTKKM